MRSLILGFTIAAAANAALICDSQQTIAWQSFFNSPVDHSCSESQPKPKEFLTPDSTKCPSQTCISYLEGKLSALPACVVNGSAVVDYHAIVDNVKASCSGPQGNFSNSTVAPYVPKNTTLQVSTLPVTDTIIPTTTASDAPDTSTAPTTSTKAPSATSSSSFVSLSLAAAGTALYTTLA
ncbi:hypothetical protein THRCLA_04403 [Thraustotheca clavata]|uniref:Secreted protein n=1 Tax=Thraustotheca clavata TaxID=74557 RepID=A0A0A7CLE0_9STRA|nr:secreted protein [Thraustotheca clavata]OQS03293.1 hypothetical protein THRCLA_04403 [Thraustotheca clavata]